MTVTLSGGSGTCHAPSCLPAHSIANVFVNTNKKSKKLKNRKGIHIRWGITRQLWLNSFQFQTMLCMCVKNASAINFYDYTTTHSINI